MTPGVIAAFKHAYGDLISGSSGNIGEDAIAPVASLPDLDADIKGKVTQDASLLKEVVVCKLNGGLGTSMGLDKAKSLLPVKDDNTFLDMTAKQIISMREKFNMPIEFLLMNSFNTSDDTLSFLDRQYKTTLPLNGKNIQGLELMQNKCPKVDKKTLLPVDWSVNKHLEWCPPGHGDLYTALYSSGKLDQLLASGVKYMFVSNSDNLGATLDLELLSYFASKGDSFMMECCKRTEADKKGGHLCLRSSDSRLMLRESAQCSKEDESSFQDVSKHQFFNTNNLWLRLDHLKDLMESRGGFVPLPTILNSKTVDPQQSSSTPVWQLETAMGAAIECFAKSGAVCVSRKRFAPVKKCSDLLLLKSDAYIINSDIVLALNPEIKGQNGAEPVIPIVSLDDKAYKLIQQLDMCTRYGVPSLKQCKKLTVGGEVWLSSGCVIVGTVNVINTSGAPRLLPPGTYTDTTVDLSNNRSCALGPLRPHIVSTTPYSDQKPGTSGLRKKTKAFEKQANYLHNFVQSTLNAVGTTVIGGVSTDITADGALIIGGDGRYFNKEAIQIIIKIAVANGIKRIVVGQNGLLSTPAVSALIRERGPQWQKAFGAFILTASHNPGGPEEDFGIKYNVSNGGPAPDMLTDEIYALTKTINSYKICNDLPDIDISALGSVVITPTKLTCSKLMTDVKGNTSSHTTTTTLGGPDAATNPLAMQPTCTVQVVSSTGTYLTLLKTVFDFPTIKAFLNRPDVAFVYDCMHGVQGPYVAAAFRELGVGGSKAPNCVILNGAPSETFGGMHADPNLTYARGLCDVMGVDAKGRAVPVPVEDSSAPPAPPAADLAALIKDSNHVPVLGVAADGDADRNMILGRHFFVTPSDSLAIIAAHANLIPYFSQQGGIKTVARSMPTSGAVDIVAKRNNLHLFETPTGWKYFGNVMDSKALFNGMSYNPVLCGEESFGTGSDHVREKDGLWAVLAWLSILAHYNKTGNKPLVHVRDIVLAHWNTYGRNYYSRYDYEGVPSAVAAQVMDALRKKIAELTSGTRFGSFELAKAEEFTYTDPIDGSIARNQGLMFIFTDGSRIIFRLSGTAGSGATIRMYMEKYTAVTTELEQETSVALEEIIKIALDISQMVALTGMSTPTVIT